MGKQKDKHKLFSLPLKIDTQKHFRFIIFAKN